MFARRFALIAAAGGALAIAGCGGSGGGGGKRTGAPAGPGQKLALRADPGGQLRFDKKTLTATAGAVTIVLANPAPLSHNVSLEGNGVEQMGDTVAQGATSTVTANLKPGSYTFYCSVPGHRTAGMVGTLTVK